VKILDIGEVAAEAGMRPSTLRYYEEIGLIASIGRQGLRRQFRPDVLLRLKLIALGKSAGFALDEIAGMFDKDGALNLPRAAVHRKADDIDRQIRELTALRNTMRHVAECRAPSHLECPKFRRLLNIAVKRGVSRKRGRR
jgi:DNA-binding transcriptional MerR regulator